MSNLKAFDATSLRAFGASNLSARGGGPNDFTIDVTESLLFKSMSFSAHFSGPTLVITADQTPRFNLEGMGEALRRMLQRRSTSSAAKIYWGHIESSGFTATADTDTWDSHPGWVQESGLQETVLQGITSGSIDVTEVGDELTLSVSDEGGGVGRWSTSAGVFFFVYDGDGGSPVRKLLGTVLFATNPPTARTDLALQSAAFVLEIV